MKSAGQALRAPHARPLSAPEEIALDRPRNASRPLVLPDTADASAHFSRNLVRREVRWASTRQESVASRTTSRGSWTALPSARVNLSASMTNRPAEPRRRGRSRQTRRAAGAVVFHRYGMNAERFRVRGGRSFPSASIQYGTVSSGAGCPLMLWVMSMLAVLIAARCRPSAALSRPPHGASVIAVKFASKAVM